MATKIYNDSWSPSNINCNWKPEKLSRYSFVTNMIDFNADGVMLNHGLINASIYEDELCNLTDYIDVNPLTDYKFFCENDVQIGIRCVTYFNINKQIIGYDYYADFGINWSLNGNFKTLSNCHYIRLTIFKQAWEKCILRSKVSNMMGEKNMTPLNIVDNKAGEKIYEDLHFEVYVKSEAFIKNFVDCFNLNTFQKYTNKYFSHKSLVPINSLFFCKTPSFYNFNVYREGNIYKKGDKVRNYIEGSASTKFVIYKNDEPYQTNKDTLEEELAVDTFHVRWEEVTDIVNNKIEYEKWLFISNQVEESNYNEYSPYVGSLLFKNLWGCDMFNYLTSYVRESFLGITYDSTFAKNLRTSLLYYDKFFNQGYFDSADNYQGSVEGFGIRLIRGESFRKDEILGDLIEEQYLDYKASTEFNVSNVYFENSHNISKNWNYLSDDVCANIFNSSVIDKFPNSDSTVITPFDHYYKFKPKIGIPFFKEKSFEDFQLEINLQREDNLGNIFKRIVNLPILVNFYNNLIKVYYSEGQNDANIKLIYANEYLNSNQVNEYTVNHGANIVSYNPIWCPDSKKLSLNTTIIGLEQSQIEQIYNDDSKKPQLVRKHGQYCILAWKFDAPEVIGTKIRAIHQLEYSDGINYDKFIYIQNLSVV